MVLNPDDSAALFYKGLLKYKNGDKARAVEAFRYSGMIGKSDFSDKWIDSIFSKDEQVASLINRLQKNPGDVKIKVSLAMAYLDYGKVKKALYYLEDAIKKNPDDVLAYAGIAEAYLQQERFAESEKVLLGILKKYPLEEALVYSSIGRVRYYARDFEGAEKYLLLSINSSVQEKTDYFPRALLGQLYVREGRIKEAQVQLEECRKSKMDDDEIDELEMKINRYERMHNGEK
jgi:cytochrome c-type biogenesis protein CcmH/NrfG